MKAYFRYQKGYLYEEHGAWYVRYRQRVPQEDGSSKLKHISEHLGVTYRILKITTANLWEYEWPMNPHR
jgi:hypothetical protein